jgi:hypothetical protein
VHRTGQEDRHQPPRIIQTPDGRPDPSRGVREFVVGTGGANLRQFRAVEPNSEVRRLRLALRPRRGRAFTDSGSGSCH